MGEEGSTIKAIAFNCFDNEIGSYLLKKDNKVFIAGKLSLNEWRGQSNVEFIIDDILLIRHSKNGPIVYRLGQLVSSNKEGFDSPDRQIIMYKIAIIEEIHKDGIDLLKKHPDFKVDLINDVTEDNMIKKLPQYDACTLRVSKLNEKILKHCPKLKAISRHGVGYDNVDLNYIKKNNIALLVTATANAVAVAEHNAMFCLYQNQ